MRIAYLMSRFPKLTETFILYEIVAMENRGQSIEVYPLIHEKEAIVQLEAKTIVDRAHYTPFVSPSILAANLIMLLTQPTVYLRTLITVIRSNWGSNRFLFGKLVYFPKAVYLAKLMQDHKIEHIHAHFASFPAAVAYMIHQFTGIPYSFTAHGSDLHRDQHMLCEKIHDAKQVITVSKYNQQVMVDYCGTNHTNKIRVLHCGVNLERFKRNTDIPTDKLIIICVGSLHEVKGQRFLLEACRMLDEGGIDFHCHFVGDGEDRDLLEQTVLDYGIKDRITFHGHLTQSDVIKQMTYANVASLNSVPTSDGRREGIPVALMEAMAFRLPVVATRLSGIPELVEDGITGFLTGAGDTLAIVDALTRLANDSELRQQMGDAGRHKIETEFDLVQNTALLLDMFRQD